MNLDNFNNTVARTEYADAIELDMRPFGAQQSEALDFWLNAALKQGDPFGKTVTIKTDASVILSLTARASLAKLQQQGVSVSVVGER